MLKVENDLPVMGHQLLDFVIEVFGLACHQSPSAPHDGNLAVPLHGNLQAMLGRMFGHRLLPDQNEWKSCPPIVTYLKKKRNSENSERVTDHCHLASGYFFFSVFTGIDRPTGTIAPRDGSAAL